MVTPGLLATAYTQLTLILDYLETPDSDGKGSLLLSMSSIGTTLKQLVLSFGLQ